MSIPGPGLVPDMILTILVYREVGYEPLSTRTLSKQYCRSPDRRAERALRHRYQKGQSATVL